jgi:hypothetical protein
VTAATTLSALQTNIIAHVSNVFATGARRVCLRLAAPADIISVICYFAVTAVAAGKRVLVLTHRSEAFIRIDAALRSHGVEYGTIATGCPASPDVRLRIADIGSAAGQLASGGDVASCFDRIIITQCEPASAAPWRSILAALPRTRIFAISTAGENLGDTFDTLVTAEDCQAGSAGAVSRQQRPSTGRPSRPEKLTIDPDRAAGPWLVPLSHKPESVGRM